MDQSEKIKELSQKISSLKQKQQPLAQTTTPSAQAIQIIIEIISGIIVGLSIGYILDELFDTKGVCLLVFTIIGGAAGIINVSRYMHKIRENREENERV